MARIDGHCLVRSSRHVIDLASVAIGLSARKPSNGGWGPRFCIDAGDAGEPEHVIERAVLEHQNKYIGQLNGHSRLPSRRAPSGQPQCKPFYRDSFRGA
jgi:hypothetical protein